MCPSAERLGRCGARRLRERSVGPRVCLREAWLAADDESTFSIGVQLLAVQVAGRADMKRQAGHRTRRESALRIGRSHATQRTRRRYAHHVPRPASAGWIQGTFGCPLIGRGFPELRTSHLAERAPPVPVKRAAARCPALQLAQRRAQCFAQWTHGPPRTASPAHVAPVVCGAPPAVPEFSAPPAVCAPGRTRTCATGSGGRCSIR
jgi:hypothetical protein